MTEETQDVTEFPTKADGTDDKRKWNVPRCASEITKLIERVDRLEPSQFRAEVPVPKDFIEWYRKAAHSLILSQGAYSSSFDSMADSFSVLSSIWAASLIVQEMDPADVLKFVNWAEKTAEDMRGFAEYRKKARGIQKPAHDERYLLHDSVTETAPAPVSRNLQEVFLSDPRSIDLPDDEG